MKIAPWIKGLFTGQDNKTPDPARHSWAFGMLGVTGAALVSSYKGVQVDLVSLATAYGLVSATGAAGTTMTKSSQPQPEDKSNASISTTVADGIETTVVETDTHRN